MNFDNFDNLTNSTAHTTLTTISGVLVLESFISSITVIGNVLVIVAILSNHVLRDNVTNIFIASLASSDLLVGAVLMPFQIQYEYHDEQWVMHRYVCPFWRATDVLACTASIWNLCTISIDRYFGVRDPLAYPSNVTFKKARIVSILVWSCSILISYPAILWWKYDDVQSTSSQELEGCSFTSSTSYRWVSSCISFYIPLLLVLVSYWKIFKAASAFENAFREQNSDRSCNRSQRQIRTSGGDIVTLRVHRGGKRLGVTKPDISTFLPSRKSTPILDSASPLIPAKYSLGANAKPRSQDFQTNYSSLDRTMMQSNVTSSYSGFTADENSFEQSSSATSSQKISNAPLQCISDDLSESIEVQENLNFKMVFQPFALKAAQNQSITREREARRLLRSRLQTFAKEKKAAKILGVVVGCFTLCWMPFFVVNLLEASTVRIGPIVYKTVVWLGYFNSGMNPIIYTLLNAEFRTAFIKLFTCGGNFSSRKASVRKSVKYIRG